MFKSEIEKEIETLIEKLEDKKTELNDLLDQRDNLSIDNLDPNDYEDDYDSMLDDIYGEFMESYSASDVLKNVDPIAYRCGLNDFMDSIDIADTKEYKNIEDEISDLKSEISDIESEIEDYKNELKNI